MKKEKTIDRMAVYNDQDQYLPSYNKLNIVVAQNKGGLGKTKCALALASIARDQDFAYQMRVNTERFKVALFSADPENMKTMVTQAGKPGDPYTTFALHNVNKREGVEDILNVLEKHQDADIVITDFRANALKFFGQITEDPEEYFTLAEELGFKTVLVIPIDGQQDSFQGLEFALTTFGDKPIYVVAHRSTEAEPYDFTRSRTKEYFNLVNEMKNAGRSIIEWDTPQVSKLVLNAAEQYGVGEYDEALIKTGVIPIVNRSGLRKGKERYITLFRELLTA